MFEPKKKHIKMRGKKSTTDLQLYPSQVFSPQKNNDPDTKNFYVGRKPWPS